MDETRKRLRVVKDNLMGRCYNPNNPKYKNYGGRGVTVCEEWHTLQGFIDGVTNLESWNENDFLGGKLQLDKDIKVKGNMCYAPETCMWVSAEDNAKVKPSYQKPFIAINSCGDTYKFDSFMDMKEKDFSGELSWSTSGLINVLKGKRKSHNEWFVYYVGTNPKYPLVYSATDGEVTYTSLRQTRIEEYIGASSGTVLKKIKNGTLYKGRWEINCYPLNELNAERLSKSE